LPYNSGRENAEVRDVAQLSRPYQIALGAVAVLGLVWMIALRGHAASPSEPAPASPSTPTAATTTPSAAAQAKAAAAPTPIYHGAAPGVEGLTRAIAKAHGAVATSQQNAQQLSSKSSQASGESQSSASAPASVASARSTTGAAATQNTIEATALARRAAAHRHARGGAAPKIHKGLTVQQLAVEHELAQGKTVMLVFWNPRSTVDQEVQAQVSALAGGSKGTVTVHAALAKQVGLFGKITEVVHVYQTPTILIVNRHRVVSTLTGLTDVFALQQAVREARSAGK
jgi:hypothetical protein